MINETSTINTQVPLEVKQQPSKEITESLQELNYMEKNLDEYKVYHDVDKLFDDILNEE